MAQARILHPNKPPNVMVFADEGSVTSIEKNIFKCLPSHKYIIYQLNSVDAIAGLWEDNTSLLIIFSDVLDNKLSETFLKYAERGGKLLSFCSNLSCPGVMSEESESKEGVVAINYEDITGVAAFRGKYSYNSTGGEILSYDNDGKPVIHKTSLKGGICIFAEVHLAIAPAAFGSDYISSDEDDEKRLNILKNILFKHFQLDETVLPQSIPSLTPGYVMADDKSLNSLLKNLKISEIPVDVFSQHLSTDEEKANARPQPLVPHNSQSPKFEFDKNIYFSMLQTDIIGRQLIYFPVIHTTMIADLFPQCDGLVLAAGEQLAGRGRGSNKWISCKGCAMFTLHITVPLSSYVGKHLSILQHVPALAAVRGIKRLDGYDKLNIAIKWPNDIYYGKECKIGGVLMNSTIQDDLAHAYIGIGINVSNSYPTMCINDVIESYNTSNGTTLAKLRTEEVIACVLNYIEHFVNDLNKSGPSNFLQQYYSSWMHEGQRVKVESANEEALVLGIDEFGFLVVTTDGGQKLVLRPDGNSFDIMKNLISLK